ncbi:c-type cytochrome [Leucothrix pacifica]|uniref:Cytochrome c5 family protein n=1 Tax=Leucothrix pacifica TaxID=1247513 RepID=A0A317CNN0_9GAMM|nr:c-type cytochrome [Leucothrix pacifica]PWQ99811.1 cytochrome c5 family protein [Leucothrix pacifica]
MEQHPQKQDSTSLILMIAGGAVLALAVIALLSNLGSTVAKNSVDDQAKKDYQQKAMTAVLQPVGNVAAVDKSLAPVERSGEQVYNAVCGACHATGLLNSPKTGSEADWSVRASLGLDGLVTSAINGKGAMPARGGNPSITDKEIRSAIVFMTADTGIDWDAPADGNSAAQDAEPAETDKTETTAASDKAPAVMVNNVAGINTYAKNCYVCHDSGAAGSPKLGDTTAWSERLAKGQDALYDSAINGVNAMPARGGNSALSDEDIQAAVDYMISTVK